MKAKTSPFDFRRLFLAALPLLMLALGFLFAVADTYATHSPPGPDLWGYQGAANFAQIGQYDIAADVFVASCVPAGSENGRGIAFDPLDGNLWYTFVGFEGVLPPFAGDGLIHKTTPTPACAALPSIPFGDGPGGAVQDDIGALDIDPDDAHIWAAGYAPIGGLSFLYKVDRVTGAILTSCSVPFGGGDVGNDTLAVAKLTGLPGSGKYLLTDAGEPSTPLNGETLLVVDAASCVGGGAGIVVAAPPKAVPMTGIDFEAGELIATDLGTIYDLGSFPFGAVVTSMSASPVSDLEDITLKTPPIEEDTRRMTGGGSVVIAGPATPTSSTIIPSPPVRVTHGFELHCDTSQSPNNLQVNWGKGNKFHLENLTSASCSDTSLGESPPVAGFDTYIGKGTGRYNGVSGATAEWTFTDAGEPGENDTANITIKDNLSNTVLNISGNLNVGNHQAHKE